MEPPSNGLRRHIGNKTDNYYHSSISGEIRNPGRRAARSGAPEMQSDE
jgi:hypothetical protein